MTDVILAGRGPSIADYEWPDDDTPICAVSSAVFSTHLPRRPEYVVAIDAAHHFMRVKPWLYLSEPDVEWFDMLNDPNIAKHVPHYDLKQHPLMHLFACTPPDHLPDDQIPNPSWDEFPNVTRWDLEIWRPLNFYEGVMGCDGIPSSAFMALQVLHRLGFKEVDFAGIQLWNGKKTIETINAWRVTTPAITWPEVERTPELV